MAEERSLGVGEVETGGDKDSHFCLSVDKDLEFNTVCEEWEVCE